MQKEVVMELFSKEYGWTPKQFRELSRKEVKDYLEIMNIRNILQNNKAKKK
jgi:hypothetical protein